MVWSNLHAALKQLWYKRLGVGDGVVPAFDNGVTLSFRNNANTLDIEALRFGGDALDQVLINGVAARPWYQGVPIPLDVANTDRLIFVNPCPFPITVKAIYESHATAESTAATLTGHVEKITGTKAAGSGTSIMSGTFDMKGTADTPQAATLLTTKDSSGTPYVQLGVGDRLAWNLTGTATELANVTLTIYFDTGGRVELRNLIAQDNTRCVDRHLHVANVPKTLLYMKAVWGVKAGAAANVQPRRGQGTEAVSAGDVLTTATIDLTGTANTVVSPTLTATTANRTLEVDDRFDFDFGGTVTAVRNLVVTLAHTPQRDGFEIDMPLLLDGDVDGISRRHFIAHQMLQLNAGRYIHAAQDAGEFVDVEIAHSATAPGGGGSLVITNNTNSGFDGGGTNETVETAAMGEFGATIMRQNDGLDTQGSDTDDTLVNVAITMNARILS